MPVVGLSWSCIARGGHRDPRRLTLEYLGTHLSTRAGGHDVIFWVLGIMFDNDIDQFIGFKVRYHSTPAAGAF